jgi:predicted O-linked N-acetylglucosamine transferase (SPINDLY family)
MHKTISDKHSKQFTCQQQKHDWPQICIDLVFSQTIDTMTTLLNSANNLPIEHWRNYLILALKGMLRLDQLFAKCSELQISSQQEEALQLYKAYIDNTTQSDKHLALFNYGSLLQSTGHAKAAELNYRACLELNADLHQARVNLGLLLEKQGLQDDALQQWQIVALRAEDANAEKSIVVFALNHIGRVRENLKQYDLAETALAKSLSLDPKQTGVIQHWVHIRQKACKWPVYASLPNITHNDMLMATSPLAMLAMTDDPVQQLLTAYAFVERTYGFKQEFLSKGRHYEHERIRIGYVSGDLCVHAVGLLLSDLFESHDRSRFEIYGYDFSPEDGTAHRQRLKNAFDHFHSIQALSDRQVAEQVLADEIDVLIDLHGLSSGARPGIFAMHPAPKQGTYLGFIGTTGMPWFDFVIADSFALPENLTTYFTEKPLCLDVSFIPINKEISESRNAQRAQYNLPENAFVMAAFGNVYKITPDMFETWLNILKKIPHSILWLVDDNITTTTQLTLYAQKYGADLNRIVFTPRTTHSEYQVKLKLADIFLDNAPYNCGSTSRDVLNAGTPLVTLSGKTMVSRMGGSILKHLNLAELISYTKDEYIDICVRLSQDLNWMTCLKQKIKINLTQHQTEPKAMAISLENQIIKMVSEK